MAVVSKAPVFDVRGDKAVIGSPGGKDVTRRQVYPVIMCLVSPKTCPDVAHTWALFTAGTTQYSSRVRG